MKHKLESRLLGEINNLRYADETTLMAESEEELKSLLMKVKEESEKGWLKTQHSKNEDHDIWSITSWQIDWKTVETVTDFIFLDSKITAVGDCSLEIKRRLLLGRKAMIKLDSIVKGRDMTLPTKVYLVKTMFFQVVIYEMSRQSRFDARYWMFGAGALGRPRGMVWGGRREEGSRWGTHVIPVADSF